eukprot:TRINITY_DN9920_c0_g1_i2.p2 TRINITY_DN9920_c0_g1~~TRINITY_DN9920_c0_g1_i2.p2  ORF type:complete len:214 (-),score=32.42 TRINITY_DN9920_c0_g1_i2:69-710(-)
MCSQESMALRASTVECFAASSFVSLSWKSFMNCGASCSCSTTCQVVNMFVLFTPRLLLFKSVTYCGINFLMETPDITSMIVNVTAMSFLLQIDELIFTHFLSHTTQHMLENLKEFEPGSASRSRDQEESEEDDFVAVRRQDFVRLVPWRMIFTVGALFTFLAEYYHAHCELQEDGSWVSAPLYLPSTILYNPICIFVECQQGGAELVWQMPKT